MPAPPVDIDPRHVFLTAKEVILRYGGRTDGYLMLRSTGFPAGSATASGSTPRSPGNGPGWRAPPEEARQGPGGRLDGLCPPIHRPARGRGASASQPLAESVGITPDHGCDNPAHERP